MSSLDTKAKAVKFCAIAFNKAAFEPEALAAFFKLRTLLAGRIPTFSSERSRTTYGKALILQAFSKTSSEANASSSFILLRSYILGRHKPSDSIYSEPSATPTKTKPKVTKTTHKPKPQWQISYPTQLANSLIRERMGKLPTSVTGSARAAYLQRCTKEVWTDLRAQYYR